MHIPPPLRFVALVLLAFSLSAALPGDGQAANDNWKALANSFKKEFKPKKSSLSTREELVKSLARSKDGRGVKLLMGALKEQGKYVEDLLEAYEEGMAEWQEKTSRLERQREERIREHVERYKKKGEEPPPISVNLASESGRWLGAPPKHIGEMAKARKRLMDQYDAAQKEQALIDRIRMGAVRILRDVEGEEFDKAVKPLLKMASTGRGLERLDMIATLGYVRGSDVTAVLVENTKNSDPAIVHAALKALGRQNTEEGKAVLLQFLEDEAWQLRTAALAGLVFYRDAEVMDALLARAAKEDGVVRQRIFRTMSSIVREPVKAILEAWQSWWPTNREDQIARFKRIPQEGPVYRDPPKMPVMTEANDGGTSFYGIKTNSKHIIFVADVSGSMARTDKDPAGEPAKIDVCREELKKAIRGLSAHDEDERGAATFNIVLFSTDVEVYKPGKMITATKKNKEKAFDWIDKHVKPDMQTNIYDGIAQAFNVISASSDKKNRERGADTIFLMTDGAPSRGTFVRPEVILEEVKKLNESRGITIHTIGVGEGHNRPFLERLAADSGGQYLAR